MIPSTASRAFFTCISQCPHIIPFTEIFMVVSLFCVLFDIRFPVMEFSTFLSCLESRAFTKFSLNAFVTTKKLERLIAAAPNMGFSFQPRRAVNAPAASGIPMTL